MSFKPHHFKKKINFEKHPLGPRLVILLSPTNFKLQQELNLTKAKFEPKYFVGRNKFESNFLRRVCLQENCWKRYYKKDTKKIGRFSPRYTNFRH